MAQRLVRVICELQDARSPTRPRSPRSPAWTPRSGARFRSTKGPGCLECSGSGYRGRSAITELLDLSDRIREMIISRRPTSEIKRAAREEGMSFLRESGLRQIAPAHHAARNQ
jgi:type II secretory ATPase GspE/PulE/Tfp pilus assembly ATPase PilB-like protein